MQPKSVRCFSQTLRDAVRRLLPAAAAALLASWALPVPASDPERLHDDPQAIFARVAAQMNVTLRSDVPLPRVYFESSTPLQQFQDAVQPQWNQRPPRFANVYVMARNEIYLSDDPAYYRRMGRTLDESLAHEFVHYVQARYFGADLADDGCELQAIAVQMSFRRDTQLLVASAPAVASAAVTAAQ